MVVVPQPTLMSLLCEHHWQPTTSKGHSQCSRTHPIALTLYCDFVMRGNLLIESVPSDDLVADIYTTQLGPGHFKLVLWLFMCH